MEYIARLETWIVPVPLQRPHVMSFGTIDDATLVVVRATSSSGVTGWGEATILGGPFWNEESVGSVMSTLADHIFPQVAGTSVHNLPSIARNVSTVRRNFFAKSALDGALNDLRARLAGVSLTEYLGGGDGIVIPVSWSLASGDLEQDLDELHQKLSEGHRIFKVKTGSRKLSDDIERVQALCGEVGNDVGIRVDANQGWTRAEAATAIKCWSDLNLGFIEQPLMKADLDGMAQLQRISPIPIAADESLETLNDAQNIINADASRVLVLKISKHGGMRSGMNIAELANAFGVDTYLGCMIESSIGTAANLSFAAALPSLNYGCELFGPALLKDDLTDDPITINSGHVKSNKKPGIGIEVDDRKIKSLSKYYEAVISGDY